MPGSTEAIQVAGGFTFHPAMLVAPIRLRSTLFRICVILFSFHGIVPSLVKYKINPQSLLFSLLLSFLSFSRSLYGLLFLINLALLQSFPFLSFPPPT